MKILKKNRADSMPNDLKMQRLKRSKSKRREKYQKDKPLDFILVAQLTTDVLKRTLIFIRQKKSRCIKNSLLSYSNQFPKLLNLNPIKYFPNRLTDFFFLFKRCMETDNDIGCRFQKKFLILVGVCSVQNDYIMA